MALVMYARDDANHLITVTTSGPVTLSDILKNIDRQVSEGTWSYAVLYDTGESVSLPSREDIDRLIGKVRTVATRLGRRGPVAIVSRSPDVAEVAREYSVVEHDVGAVGFFRDVAAAERWLAMNAAASPGR